MKIELLLFSICCIIVYCAGDLIVKANEGLLKGKRLVTKNGKEFAAYTGIPYAEPPVGTSRFKPPLPKTPWTDIKDATKPHNICPQMDLITNPTLIQGHEDCLYLNVYTPIINQTQFDLIPVLFYIHGGGYFTGHANLYPPEILLDRNVVLVTTNYRIGALGFLSTGDEIVPGNNGLKDQNLAIKWTKDNVKVFGGDPERITLCGQSAGGSSVHFHVLSTLSRGLFSAAISQSGTALSAFAYTNKKEASYLTKKLANIFNCNGTNAVMIECLRHVDALKLIEADAQLLKWHTHPLTRFGAVVEIEHEGAFLTSTPLDSLKSGNIANVPWVVGFTKDEGSLQSVLFHVNSNPQNEFLSNFNKLAPTVFLYEYSAKDVNKLSDKLKKFYLGEKVNFQNITDLYTDVWALGPTQVSIKYHLKHVKQPIYYYFFAYRGVFSFTSIFGSNDDLGVSHADELFYLFPVADYMFPKSHHNSKDQEMTKLMTNLWSNFAKYSNFNNSDWAPVTTIDGLEYFNISSPTETNMYRNIYPDRSKFWEDIIEDDLVF